MTITTQAIKAVAQGNGANTNWPFTFLIPDESYLEVTLVDVASGNETVIPPANYTVTGIGNDAGGSVTYPTVGSPVTASFYVVVERVLPLTQDTDLVNQSGAYPQDIEDALDYLTMVTQQLQDSINRSIVFSIADSSAGTLPTASARANKVLGFDGVGNPAVLDVLTPGTTVSPAMIPVVTAPTTSAALAALGLPGSLLDLLIPSGAEWPYHAGGAAPAGFVYPIGQACTPTYPDYRAKLIAAGSPYGTNGVDPLMPDRRSTVVAGKSNMGGVDNGLLTGGTVLGAVLGSQSVTLTSGQIPAHLHPITDKAHSHDQYMSALGGVPQIVVENGSGVTSDSGINTGLSFTGITSTDNNVGGGGSHSNVQPTLIANVILKVH